MLYSTIEIAQAAGIGGNCIKAMAFLVIIGVAIFIGVELLKNLKPLS